MAVPSADYPDAVVFKERDGLFWLSGPDLRQFEAARGVEYGCESVGFDRDEARAQVLELMQKGVMVGLKRDATIRLLRLPAAHSEQKLNTTPVFLAPNLLIDPCELDRLACRLTLRTCHIRARYERWRSELLGGLPDLPVIYVLRLADAMYEVDWQHTEVSEETLQALALAAHTLGVRLTCRLVSPLRYRHSRVPARRTEPRVYGQLRFGL